MPLDDHVSPSQRRKEKEDTLHRGPVARPEAIDIPMARGTLSSLEARIGRHCRRWWRLPDIVSAVHL